MDFYLGEPSRPGPEAEMVEQFVDEALPRSCRGENRTVLIEPQIGARRPDIVVVYWNPSIS